MDDELRRLERRWLESQDPADEGRYLLARVRKGELPLHALKVAAWVGVEGPGCALPDLVEPALRADSWEGLTAWAAGLADLIGGYPRATWRLMLAEGERLLQVLAEPPAIPAAGRLILIEGPRSGEVVPVSQDPFHPLHIGADGRPVALAESVFRLEGAPGGWRLINTGGEILINGEVVTEPQLAVHGDLISFGEYLAILDASDEGEDRADARDVARVWLDELTAWVASGETSTELLPPLRWGSGPVAWLHEQLPLLRAAIGQDSPSDLSGWPLNGRELGREAQEWPAEIRAGARGALGPWALQGVDPLRVRAKRALDTLEIASPCPLTWDELSPRPGQPQVRDCSVCQFAVYDLSTMSRDEAEQLLGQEGRVCVRLYRRADGRVMTRDCPGRWRVPAEPGMMGMIV